MIQYGMSFDKIKTALVTGVTLICSIVPISFSLTILRAGKKPQSIVSNITIKAGTI